MAMLFSRRLLLFVVLGLFLEGCQYFMSPQKLLESSEADELCYQWKEESRREIIKFGMDYTLFNRRCKLNSDETMYLGYEGKYLTGNREQDGKIMANWTVVKTFRLKN
tara:strand:+ start:111 stop:434 length:324 start_codon:yes stop_codon:yes gene_type:complete